MLFSRLSITWIALVAILGACSETTYKDVSSQPGYREIIGATYTVVGPVSAYGIRKHSQAAIESISIIVPPGIEGPEVGLQMLIPLGSKLTVVGVYESNRIFDPSLSLEIKLSGVILPANLPVRIHLMRGTQGADKLSLNPAVFLRN